MLTPLPVPVNIAPRLCIEREQGEAAQAPILL